MGEGFRDRRAHRARAVRHRAPRRRRIPQSRPVFNGERASIVIRRDDDARRTQARSGPRTSLRRSAGSVPSRRSSRSLLRSVASRRERDPRRVRGDGPDDAVRHRAAVFRLAPDRTPFLPRYAVEVVPALLGRGEARADHRGHDSSARSFATDRVPRAGRRARPTISSCCFRQPYRVMPRGLYQRQGRVHEQEQQRRGGIEYELDTKSPVIRGGHGRRRGQRRSRWRHLNKLR
jgi:hypothetical protein